MSRSVLATLYAALAVVGAVAPYIILLPWTRTHGFDPGLFFSLPFATAPAALFSTDLLLSATVFLLFATVEGRCVGVPLWIACAARCRCSCPCASGR